MTTLKNEFILLMLFIGPFLFGCTDVQVKEERKSVTDIGVNEKISFILDRSKIKDVDEAQEIEIKIEKCIDKALKKLEPPIQTVSAETFRKNVFPGLDYLSVPSSPDSINALLKSQEFRKRIESLRLRYLLILQGKSGFINTNGGFAGSVMIVTWDKQTKMSACILDLVKSCNAGDIKAEALGHGWFAILGVFPIGFPAISEGSACKALGQKVASFIAGNRPKQ